MVKKVDAIVVGGGPAGLSGAMLLGRCRRSVLVFDEGRPRNEKSRAVHAYLGVHDVAPSELLSRGRKELQNYPRVSFFHESVAGVIHEEDTFRVVLLSGMEFRSRSLLLATGIIDRLPELPGLKDFYGKSIHLCPYCDGWESSGQRIAVMGSGDEAAELALEMLIWSSRIVLFIDGDVPSDGLRQRLAARQVTVEMSAVTGFLGHDGDLRAVTLQDGRQVECDRMFLVASQVQHDDFIQRFGFGITEEGKADCGNGGETGVPGLFIAGNAAKGLQLAMVAAAEGLHAAHGINNFLLSLDE